MATLLYPWNSDVKFTKSTQHWYYDVAPTLGQLCEERQMGSNGFMVTSPKCYVKVIKKINNQAT